MVSTRRGHRKRQKTNTERSQRHEARSRKKESSDPPRPPERCNKCTLNEVDERFTSFKFNCKCKWKVCSVCFSEILVENGGRGCFDCGGSCGEKITSWDIQHPQDDHLVTHSLKVPDSKDNPVLYHRQQGPNGYYGITLSHWEKNSDDEDVLKHKTHWFPKDEDCALLSEQHVKFLENFCKILHVLVINNDKEKRMPFDPVSTATREEIFEVASSDYSPLHRCIFSLCRGDNLLDAIELGYEQTHRGFKSLVCNSFAVADIIRNAGRQSTGIVKATVSQQLRVDNSIVVLSVKKKVTDRQPPENLPVGR